MKAMDEQAFERLESQLRRAGQDFEYPRTPEAAVLIGRRGGVNRRVHSERRLQPQGRVRPVWVAALVALALLVSALSMPRVRAAVAEFLQIGVVRIFQTAPTDLPPRPTPPPTALPASPAAAGTTAPEFPMDLIPSDRLDGATTLEAAQRAVPFPVRLPAYPPDLGAPDGVYLQEMDGAMLVLVWNDRAQPERPALSLNMIEPGSWAITKVQPLVVTETSVDGRPAVWAVGPYLLQLKNQNLEIGRLIDGNVLIWEQDGVTYRLETALPLEEAIKIAESLE
jgi:hypothetical protein